LGDDRLKGSAGVREMKLFPILFGVAAMALLGGAAHADQPAAIYGKWIELYPNGEGMVTEFADASISSYPVDREGHPLGAPTRMQVTYNDLGGAMIGVSFNGGGGAIVARTSPDAITLDLPGVGAHALAKMKPGADRVL
jgi:hypothetical protein